MARSVSLSDSAFEALRAEKREGESDSDVILRLRREALARRKDPMAFVRRGPRYEGGLEALMARREANRAADAERDAERGSEDA